MHVFSLMRWAKVKPDRREVLSTLCCNCNKISTATLFASKCDISRLQQTSRTCDLCGLLFNALLFHNYHPPQVITLSQTPAIISIEGGPDLLSVYVQPGTDLSQGARLGLPKLPKEASSEQFTIINEWIRSCDQDHEMCCRDDEQEALSMPTRLIELSEGLRLIDTKTIQKSRYVALSHCWGRDSSKFCTYRENIDQFKKDINAERLPRTYSDAITVVRGLGIRYIWIDSLCIIQDDLNDWEDQSRKMGEVFSSAYFTIGASSAESSVEGFLTQRKRRGCVQLQTERSGAIYVCPAIDDFHNDVELSVLNRRGWVLQERVLSRRSVYFTATQIYWECGMGVHCETLARLQNSKAAFLSDANFPKSALKYYRDGRQVLIQDLFEQYSGLGFTRPSDRSVAILGLQERLARALWTQAAYGFFAIYFARGLLWERSGARMVRIVQPADHEVPSWSWMSKTGTIRYMNLKFEGIEWATTDFENPFEYLKAEKQWCYERPIRRDLAVLRGYGRRMIITQRDMLRLAKFDDIREFKAHNLLCVVIGRDKFISGGSSKCYVMLIHQGNSTEDEVLYERVGVASLKRLHVENEGTWVTIR